MRKRNKYRYIERLYPRRFMQYILRVMVLVGILLGILSLVIIMIYAFIMENRIAAAVTFAMIIFIVRFGGPFLVSFIKETLDFYRYPSIGFKSVGRLYLDRDQAILLLGKRKVKVIRWEDAVVIEKFNEEMEYKTKNYKLMDNKIIIMTENYLGKHQRDEKYINYIEVPARKTIEEAIKKFSTREIAMRKYDEDGRRIG